jgi:hypothetical protein
MDETLLPTVSDLLSAVEIGIGERSDARIRAAIRAISGQAGSLGLAEKMRTPGGTSEEESGRTFIWLAAAARCAVEHGEAVLTLRIFYFAKFFEDHVQPNLTMADTDDLRVSLVPGAAMAEIVSASLVALPRLGPDAGFVVLNLGSAPVEAWTIGKMVGERALEHEARGRSLDPG